MGINRVFVGLAVYPTWLVAKETRPLEEQEGAGLVDSSVSDTGAEKVTGVDRVGSLDEKDKSKFAAARTSIGQE